MRFQTVDNDGRYSVQNEQAKLLIRGTMTLVRVGLCEIAAHHAARATLIAIRYAVVRRQGSSKDKVKNTNLAPLERQIIDYAGVQQRLFTAVASSYALTFAARHMRAIYNELQTVLQSQGESPLLGIVHGYTSVLKAVITGESYNVVWRCRKSMGGLGYSAASGLTDLENSQPDANLTYEGDNNMLLGGPAANFLVKELAHVISASGKTRRPELRYLSQRPKVGERLIVQDEFSFTDPALQLRIVGHRAARLVYSLFDLRRSNVTKNAAYEQLDANLAARASRAHGTYFILYAFIAVVDSLRRIANDRQSCLDTIGIASLDNNIFAALDQVRILYALEVCILDNLGDYTEDGYLDLSLVDELRRESAATMVKLRPNALGLIEAVRSL